VAAVSRTGAEGVGGRSGGGDGEVGGALSGFKREGTREKGGGSKKVGKAQEKATLIKTWRVCRAFRKVT